VAEREADGQAMRDRHAQAAVETARPAGMPQPAGDRSGALTTIEPARRSDPSNPGLPALPEALVAGRDGQ
jgi:hypothetical protein